MNSRPSGATAVEDLVSHKTIPRGPLARSGKSKVDEGGCPHVDRRTTSRKPRAAGPSTPLRFGRDDKHYSFNEAPRTPAGSELSEILRSEAGLLRNASKHPRSDFFIVMKSEHIVAKRCVVEFNVGAFLRDDTPTFFDERSKDELRFGAGPIGQAEALRMEIVSGMFRDFSTSSAIEYKANAYALALASSTVAP